MRQMSGGRLLGFGSSQMLSDIEGQRCTCSAVRGAESSPFLLFAFSASFDAEVEREAAACLKTLGCFRG